MKIRTLKCQNCGAPLKVDESRRHITCPYCGITNIIFEEHLVKETTETTQIQIQKARKLSLLIVSLVLALVIAGISVFIIVAFSR